MATGFGGWCFASGQCSSGQYAGPFALAKNASDVLVLRIARPSEAQALTELAIRSKRGWGYDERFMELVMPDMIVHPEYLLTGRGIVAEDSGTVVGYAIVKVDGKRAFLRDLFVEPNRQRRGIGKALFLKALCYALRMGVELLTLSGDPNAVAFYERMGMRKVGEELSRVGGGRVLPIMALDLDPVAIQSAETSVDISIADE